MNIISRFFGFGCVPVNNQNHTLAYVAQVADEKNNDIVTRSEDDQAEKEISFPDQKQLYQEARIFINRKIQDLSVTPIYENLSDNIEELKNMYILLAKCLNDRVAQHIWVLANAKDCPEKTLEDLLKNNYLSLLRKPEWVVTWSQHPDLTNHPYFAKFYKCQLKSDFLYRKNSHELFTRMQLFMKYLMKQDRTKKNKNLRLLLEAMKRDFDEYVARDLLVIYYQFKSKNGTKKMENYVLAKYGYQGYEIIPDNFNLSTNDWKDADIPSHPFFTEYLLAKKDLKLYYSFKCVYKQAAEDWIEHRLKVRDGIDRLPEIVEKMYSMMTQNLTSSRAYELFILSQYRMDGDKIKRMEAYLSEKYRQYLSNCNLEKVNASYPDEPSDSLDFCESYPFIADTIKLSKTIHPVYTKEMVDTVIKMLVNKKKLLKLSANTRIIPKKTKRHAKLLDFLYNRINEERVRELYAMYFYGVENWEDAFFYKYKVDIELLKDFEVVDKYTI